MKKLFILLALSILFSSCTKEDLDCNCTSSHYLATLTIIDVINGVPQYSDPLFLFVDRTNVECQPWSERLRWDGVNVHQYIIQCD